MTANNESKRIFKDFIEKTGFKRDTQRNVFSKNGRLYAFATINNNKFKIRQLYQDCDGAYIFHAPSNMLYQFRKSKMSIGSVTRITPNGIKAFDAKVDKKSGFRVGRLY